MPAQTHACGANPAVAIRQADERVDAECGILVISRKFLLDLPGIAFVCARAVVRECFGTSELVVAAWCGDDVAMAGDLAGETLDWAGHLVDLAEDDDAREFGFRVVGDGRREEDAYLAVRTPDSWRMIYQVVDSVRISPPCLVGTSLWVSVINIVDGAGDVVDELGCCP
jgi:hypothetical protein